MTNRPKSQLKKIEQYNISNRKDEKLGALDIAILVAVIIPFMPP